MQYQIGAVSIRLQPFFICARVALRGVLSCRMERFGLDEYLWSSYFKSTSMLYSND